MSVLKRQRELKRVERAARKRARKHGLPFAPEIEPRPTVTGENPEDGGEPSDDELAAAEQGEGEGDETPAAEPAGALDEER